MSTFCLAGSISDQLQEEDGNGLSTDKLNEEA